ncbi:hypothetical protein N0V90_003173 [Kalmusia sp. IMI 367209]|nr:hypothetical protein N0V90_003173 [Kalmusia sp. IMI 367209]
MPTLQSSSVGNDKSTAIGSDRAFATLLCAVYYASIISIVHGPNPSDLAQSINAVGLWSALRREMTSRLNIMDESFVQAASMEFLQAMVLYLSVELGTVNPQRQWLQLGTTIHMAQSLGVHRDPSTFGLNPIEIETRRRLWAQICILDGRLAEQLCREPAINPDTYDIALPLSLSDQGLSDLDLQSRPTHRGSEMNFTSFQEVEDAQEHAVPFSSMALLIVEAETARQQQQLLCLRYNPRDRPLRNSSTSPQLARRAIPFSGRTDRTQWANELQSRLSTRYNWDHFDSSDPMQYLVAEICQINLLKIKLMGSMTQRREMPAQIPYGHPEILSVEDTSTAWSVLDQLFPADASQRPMEPGMRETLLEKIVAKARMKKQMRVHIPVGSHLGEQAMHPPTGGFAAQIAPHPPVTSPTNFGQRATFQATTNIFEDWDALVQEQIWPGSLPGDNN